MSIAILVKGFWIKGIGTVGTLAGLLPPTPLTNLTGTQPLLETLQVSSIIEVTCLSS